MIWLHLNHNPGRKVSFIPKVTQLVMSSLQVHLFPVSHAAAPVSIIMIPRKPLFTHAHTKTSLYFILVFAIIGVNLFTGLYKMSKPCKQMSKIVKNVKSVKMSRLLLFQYIICFHFLVVFFFFKFNNFFLIYKIKTTCQGKFGKLQ